MRDLFDGGNNLTQHEIATLIDDIAKALEDGNFKRCSTPSHAPQYVKEVARSMYKDVVISNPPHAQLQYRQRPVPTNKKVLAESLIRISKYLLDNPLCMGIMK